MRATCLRGFSFAVVITTVCSLVVAGEADDPSGDWKWSMKRVDGKEVKFSAELKYADGKLTGTVQRTNDPLKKKIEIEDGAFNEGTISFSTSEQGPGGKVVKKYKGTLAGDKIIGKLEIAGFRKDDWEASR